jgi:hypothetical protein
MFKDSDYAAKLLPDPANCAHCRALRYDTNVLVLQRLSELSTLSTVNLTLAIGCVMYLGSTIVCLIYTIDSHTVSDAVFHRLEFGGTFAFTLITTLALVFSPERRFKSPLVLKILVLIDVCASFVAMVRPHATRTPLARQPCLCTCCTPALLRTSGANHLCGVVALTQLLVFLSLDSFERVAHEIEYGNEFCTSVVDVLILLTLEPSGDETKQRWQRVQLLLFGTLAACVPVLQLVVYNSDWGGEERARYVEFAFNSTSAAVSFWFCTDSMIIADRMKLEIMLAPAELTVVIDATSRRAVHDHGEPPSLSRLNSPYAPPPLDPCATCPNCSNPASDNKFELPIAMAQTGNVEERRAFRVSKGTLPLPADAAACLPCKE